MAEGNGMIIVEGATIVDGNGGAPIEQGRVVIQNGRFVEVGHRDGASFDNATVVDASGKWIIPGLWDMHIHYRDWMAEILLANGVTSILDLGNMLDWILAQRDGARKGKIYGPRIFSCGAAIGADPENVHEGSEFITARTVEEAVRYSEQLLELDVDAIKLWAFITTEQIKAASEVAHAAGRKVIGHITTNGRHAAQAGMDYLAHATGIPPAAVKDPKLSQWIIDQEQQRLRTLIVGQPGITAWGLFELMEEDTFDELSETLVREDCYIECDSSYRWPFATSRREQQEFEDFKTLNHPRLSYIPDLTRQRNQRAWETYGQLSSKHFDELHGGYEKFNEFIRRFVKAGGKLLVGTDTSEGRMAGINVHRELQYFVDIGLPPLEVLKIATRHSAEFLDKQGDLGTIETGKIADLLILSKDPLQDIANTRSIETVIQNGQLVDTAFHPAYQNPIPRPLGPVLHGFPLPVVHSIEPTQAAEGAQDLSITIRGKGFVRASTAQFGSSRVPTELVGPNELRLQIPARLLATVGTYDVVVSNPQPVEIVDPLHQDERSNPAFFMVTFA